MSSSNFLTVLKSALVKAKDSQCTRFPDGNGYKEGHSALEYVNKAFTENNVIDANGKVVQLNKSQFNKILNSVELKEAGLTRFDGENGLRKSSVDVLSMFGLTAAPKSHRTKTATAAQLMLADLPVASETVAMEDDNDFGDFN